MWKIKQFLDNLYSITEKCYPDTCTYILATFQIKVSLFNVVFGENVGIRVIMLVKNRQNSEVFFFFPSSLIENDRKKRIVYCIYQQVKLQYTLSNKAFIMKHDLKNLFIEFHKSVLCRHLSFTRS